MTASPQTENGYTAIANELLEALGRINVSGAEMQVFLVILRKTYGFKKKEDYISLSQFTLATGMQKPNVCRALSKLITKNMIIKIDKASPIKYRIQKDYTTWTPLSKLIRLSKQIMSVIHIDNKSLSKQMPTKESKDTKETITKEKALLPEWVPEEEFNEYKKMRKLIRKPMTERAVSLAIGKLEKLKNDGFDSKQVLEQSILHSWSGLFPIKEQEQKSAGMLYNETSNEIVRLWVEEKDEEYRSYAEEIIEKRKKIAKQKVEAL